MDCKVVSKTAITRESSDAADGEESDQVVKIKKKECYFFPGNVVKIGSKALKIKFIVPAEDFRSGKFFLKQAEEIKSEHKKKVLDEKKKIIRRPGLLQKGVKTGFVVPVKDGAKKRLEKMTQPLHSPTAPGAVILFKPATIFEQKIPVVVDPLVARFLRPHQIDGVKFMFECVMGMRTDGNGCILADDMGLGKTLQAITLIWTLLNQSPSGIAAVKKCVIVCPSSLVGNWCNEFKKWLGGEVDPIPMGDANKKKVNKALARFGGYGCDVKDSVLVVSYDQLRIHIKAISEIPGIDLVVCDEGHRLKNAKIKTSIAVNQLPTPNRIILSGTPIQNNLDEFHAMVSFVNPRILGDINKFRRLFKEEIDRMRDPESTPEEKRIGRERAIALTQLTGTFVLRRTAKTNAQYLPAKVDNLVICRLTPLQSKLYTSICKSSQTVVYNDTGRKGRETSTLAALTHLKKLCNEPSLVYEEYKEAFADEPHFKPGVCQPEFSGKLQFVEKLLASLKKNTKDKIVIVSNYTQTLDVLAKLCKMKGYGYFQLDGQTKVSKRQQLVDLFNNPNGSEFVFLLSSKAGGCGLNLVGANHLVLYDPDWNPANDAQAMARVWRPGQQKKVYLYRTLSTGTIEEKIYQRQVAKLSLETNIVAGQTDVMPDFSKNELKELFNYKEDTISDTHDLLNCRCSKSAKKIPLHKRQSASVDELSNWQHCDDTSKLTQYPVLQASGSSISFVFIKEDDPAAQPKKVKLIKNEKLCFDDGSGAGEDEGEGEADYEVEAGDEEPEKVATEKDEEKEEEVEAEEEEETKKKPSKTEKTPRKKNVKETPTTPTKAKPEEDDDDDDDEKEPIQDIQEKVTNNTAAEDNNPLLDDEEFIIDVEGPIKPSPVKETKRGTKRTRSQRDNEINEKPSKRRKIPLDEESDEDYMVEAKKTASTRKKMVIIDDDLDD
eukprot:TRINITY_DN500_c0_g1_i3.p1 TRINITY_DN500_c0_g1~~TRINITY_DN500_c0_g1_i3.p1  ORF type:complete len:943 (-),score=202.97 TRINITY_DN500_c0_g1_i3:122-2950(-)